MPRWAVAKVVGWLDVTRRALLVTLTADIGEATAGLITGRESDAGMAAGVACAYTGEGVKSDGSGG
jgi:hypothetical protein